MNFRQRRCRDERGGDSGSGSALLHRMLHLLRVPEGLYTKRQRECGQKCRKCKKMVPNFGLEFVDLELIPDEFHTKEVPG